MRSLRPSEYDSAGLEQPAIDPIMILASLINPSMIAAASSGARNFARSAPRILGSEAGEMRLGPYAKGYAEQKYPFSQNVKVEWPNDPSIHYDSVKGMSRGHAMYRAKENWPGANVAATGLSESGMKQAKFLRDAILARLNSLKE